MKALCVFQPWTSLIMIGAKPNEFRKESYLNPRSYRGAPKVGERIVLHAAARRMVVSEIAHLLNSMDCPPDLDQTGLIREIARPFLLRIWNLPRGQWDAHLPLGCGLGTAVIGQPILAADIPELRKGHTDSDRGEFNWAWPMEFVHPWDEPIPMRGRQGFWEWPVPSDAQPPVLARSK